MRFAHDKRWVSGYTLIEILMAIGIFSVLSLIAYSALNTLSSATEAAEVQGEMLADLQLTIARLDADLQSVVGRPSFDASVSSAGGDFFGQATAFGGIRSGWTNPLGQARSELQRFQWQFEAGTLQRLYWPTVYPTRRSDVQVESLAVELEGWSIRYFSPTLGWQSQWQARPGEALPQAVELILNHARYGEIRRLIVLN